MNKKAQVTLYIIIAIVLVAGILTYALVTNKLKLSDTPTELTPVFEYYKSCIEQETKIAVELAGLQGGHVKVPDYIPGSEWAPFSSHLNFLGGPVPYWYYLSGNGIIKEDIPTKPEIEREIANYVEENLKNCDFEYYYKQGFLIDIEEPEVDVKIEDTITKVEVSTPLAVTKGDSSERKTVHNVELNTKLGKFYNLALEIYTDQKQNVHFEQYATDVLYSYAPVDGVEIQCGPKIWSTTNVINDIKQGLEENFKTIKYKGDYYELKNKEREYFVIDKNVDETVNLMYSKSWPTKIEINGEGVDDQMMIAEAMGNQEGMGAMGFCYVPYHFVYDVSFPTLIQIYNTEELFQFPITVIIDKNVPRQAEQTNLAQEEEFDLCEYKTKQIEVNVFNTNLDKVDTNISFECFTQRCRLGQTTEGKYVGQAPACVNGYLHLKADGFTDKKQLISTNSERFADVIMEREYNVPVNVNLGGQPLDGTAIITFVRDDDKTSTISYPSLDQIKLSEGSYEVKVYVYGDSKINLPESTKTQCVDVPKEGLLGFFGATKEKCFDVTIPATKIDYALIGGGVSQTYILESELEKDSLTINVDKLPTPTSIEQLGQNFEIFETRGVILNFNEQS